MLQRIQSVYLLFGSIAFYALFLFPLVHNVYVDSKPLTISIVGVYQDVNGQQALTQSFTLLTIGAAIVGLIPLIIIFMYKNRKQQILFGYITAAIIIAFSFWMSQTVKGIMGSTQIDTHSMGIGIFLSTISLAFIFLAIRAIQRDQKLVKSADRLR
jgi:hypothetical protein